MNKSEKLSTLLELFNAGLIELSGDKLFEILEIPMSFKFDTDDDVQITDQWHKRAGDIGTVVGRYYDPLIARPQYRIRIDGVLGTWMGDFDEQQLKIWTNASAKNNNIAATSPSPYVYIGSDWTITSKKTSKSYCNHTWKEDFANPFSANRYYSCRGCGKKKEEHDAETKDDVPF